MAITFHACKCPSCGAKLKYEEGRKQMFCEFCGTKILIENDNEFTHRIVDEAKIKEAEVELERAKNEKAIHAMDIEADRASDWHILKLSFVGFGGLALFCLIGVLIMQALGVR